MTQTSGRRMTGDQWCFILSEMAALSVRAAFARAGIYRKGVPDKESIRKPVHRTLKAYLGNKRREYESGVLESRHLENIEALSRVMADSHGELLRGGVLRIGPAQKALNLYLKYMWCLGQIGTPPHCPIDARILEKAPEVRDVKWTAIDSVGEYMRCIRALRSIAGTESLAEWECRQWNEG